MPDNTQVYKDTYADTPIPDYIDELVPMDLFTDDYPISIDIVYNKADHPNNPFGKAYRDDVRLWLHGDLAAITLLSAIISRHHFDWSYELYDGLRTTTAQVAIAETNLVKSKPTEWQKEYISAPGVGSHPRGLAIDTLPVIDGQLVNMGAEFADLPDDTTDNPSARYYLNFTHNRDQILANRKKFQASFQQAADALGHSLWKNDIGFYPEEVWHHDFYIQRRDEFPVISDAHLPKSMRMTDRYLNHGDPDNSPDKAHWDQLADQIHDQVQSVAHNLNL